MNVSQIGVLFASLAAAAAADAQSMFRGDAMHSGRYAGPGAATISSREMEISDWRSGDVVAGVQRQRDLLRR